MADHNEIKDHVNRMAGFIDGSVDAIANSAEDLQYYAYREIQEFINSLDTESGRILPNQSFTRRLIQVENAIKEKLYTGPFGGSITVFLRDLNYIHQRTVDLNKTINQLNKEIKALPDARKMIYDQAKTAFNEASIGASYLQPMRLLLARQVLTNATIKQTLSLIEKWDSGELSSGRLNLGQPAPNFQRYATQMARDTAYSMNRTTNEIIANELELDGFVYAGGLVADSRPLCRHLVNANRPFALAEMPKLISSYPEGLYPGTTRANFIQYCGGYGCRHSAQPVKIRNVGRI